MSGLVALLGLDGAPADAALLRRMTDALAFRAPDGIGTWSDGPAGLGHALLDTGDEPAPLPQPATLDGELWISADARIDARDDLARRLRAAGESASPDAPVAELILRAYRAWGEECPARLLGDFAFAVWDRPKRRLFCARDHFGVKPLYHALAGRTLVVSNTLECVRLHPDVPGALNDAALADFLVHGHPQDGDATSWAAIHALPPGHALTAEDGRVRVRRWWELPRHDAVHLRRPRDYADRFVELLGAAVRDRLPRSGRAGLLMSGGQDSTAIAALAREAGASDLRAFTAVYDRLLSDQERRFATVAGEALGIPITFLPADGYAVYERAEEPAQRRPEPADSVLLAIESDQHRQAAEFAPVLLTGLGGDAALRETPSRLTRLAARGRLIRALREAAEYAWWHRRLPRPGVRTWLRARRGAPKPWIADLPPWIADDFARRAALAERVAARNAREVPRHPVRPEAYEQLIAPLWPALFTAADPGVMGVPVEERHPFFDVRVVEFLLSVPPAQWYNDKGLLRMGMRGRLPARVVRRPKVPLPGDPLRVRQEKDGDAWLGGRTLGSEVAPWIDADRVPRVAGGRGGGDGEPLWLHLRPLSLSLWLRTTAGR